VPRWIAETGLRLAAHGDTVEMIGRPASADQRLHELDAEPDGGSEGQHDDRLPLTVSCPLGAGHGEHGTE